MKSSDYYRMVREYTNKHGVSIERARSEIGKHGAEVRKRKTQAAKEVKTENTEYWWNKD
jgi:hypothetical protein